MSVISEMGIIGTEVKLDQTKNGTPIVEIPLYFNSYVPGVGKTTKEVQATVWGEKAKWLVAEAAKHKVKDKNSGQERATNGKGMPLFFIGRDYTHKYQGKNGMVKQERFQVLDMLYNKVPIIACQGRIGTVVSPEIVKLKSGGQTVKVEVPVFFNGYVPGAGQSTLETWVTIWGERATWLHEQAEKHERTVDGVTTKTEGKGMLMDFVCYIYTNTYNDKKSNRMVAVDVTFPSGIFSSAEGTTSTQTTTTNSKPAQTDTQKAAVTEAPPTEELKIDFEGDLDLGDLGNLGDSDLGDLGEINFDDDPVGDFNKFLENANK